MTPPKMSLAAAMVESRGIPIRQPDIRAEDGLGQPAKPSPPGVAQILGSVLGDETRSEIGLSAGHFGESIGNDRMGVHVDCRQSRGPLTFAVWAGGDDMTKRIGVVQHASCRTYDPPL